MEFSSSGYVVRPLHDFSFAADNGQLVVLLGPSGCGKTTLLSCLAGLLTPTSGTIKFAETDVTALTGSDLSEYRRHSVGVIFQAFNLIASLTARANVMVPLRLAGVRRGLARERADLLLEEVGLSDRAHHRPQQMSGGQQQRVAIARALVQDPPLILADEPTAHLDYVQVEEILRLLRNLASPGRIVVVATHDERITQLADNVIELIPHLPDTHRQLSQILLNAGDVLFRQGDPSDLVYTVNSGELEIYRELEGGAEQPLRRVRLGDYFGELGPLMNLPRGASVRACDDAVLTGYPPRLFRSLHPGGYVQES